MSAKFYLYPKKKFDVATLRSMILRYDWALPDPSDPAGLLVAESREGAIEASRALAQIPLLNPWVVLLHLEPDVIHVYREATRPALDSFKLILNRLLLPETSSAEDDEGRLITAPEGVLIADYLVS